MRDRQDRIRPPKSRSCSGAASLGDHRARHRRQRAGAGRNAIWPKREGIRKSLQPACRIEIGGAIEESEKGNASISKLFHADGDRHADTLLMIQLQSFSRLVLGIPDRARSVLSVPRLASTSRVVRSASWRCSARSHWPA